MNANALARAFRLTTRHPFQSLLVVAILAIGIGATSAVFSVVDAALLRPAPYRDAQRLVELWNRDPDGRAWPRLEPDRAATWLTRSDLFAQVERYTDRTMLLGGIDDPEELRVDALSRGFLAMLGVRVTHGRAFAPDEYETAAAPVVVVSEAFWRKHFVGEPMSSRHSVLLDDRRYDVIGVAPAWFAFPHGIGSVWRPLRPDESGAGAPLNYVARLADGVPPSQAVGRLEALGRQLEKATPRKDGWGVYPAFLIEPEIDRDLRTAIWVLMGAVACVMLMVSLNATNLLLVQATTRQREFGIQQALGATPWRLARQVLLEGSVLACAAAASGIGLAWWALDVILAIAPRELPRFGVAPRIDGRALAFAVGVSVVATLVATLGPALHAARARGQLVTAGGGRTQTGGVRLQRLRATLIVAELSLSLVLLAGAGLFIASLRQLVKVDPGFDVARVVAAQIGVPAVRYATPEARAALLDRLDASMRRVPGVTDVSFSSGLPPQADVSVGSSLESEGITAPVQTGDIVIPFAEVDSGFFHTLGVRILRGRGFTAADLEKGAEPKAVISRSLAELLWRGQDPIGKRYRMIADGPWRTVVGIAADVKLMGPDSRRYPYSVFYPRPRIGRATRTVAVAIRTTGVPSAIVASLRGAIHDVDPELPIPEITSAGARFAESMSRTRFVLALMTCFASIALALAVAGTYGVVSYTVAQRTREMGIRMALGASPPAIVRGILAQGALLIAVAVGVGLVIVAAAGPLVTPQLFGVAPHDPLVLWMASGLVALTTLAAVLVPARRASRVNPVIAMLPD